MGQATADLPNSEENVPTPIAGADDLLSQLAGEEIDRMLAEADVRPDSAVAEAAPIPAIPTIPDEKPPAHPAMPAAATNIDLPPAPAPAATATTEEPPPSLDAQVDELFKELDQKEAQQKAVAPKPEEPKVEVPAAPVAAATAVPAEITEPSTTAAEREALNAPAAAEEALQAALANATMETVPSTDQPPAKPSIVVRILEVINAPVASLPNSVRDMIGKIALLTLMNSVAVVIYVLLFRH